MTVFGPAKVRQHGVEDTRAGKIPAGHNAWVVISLFLELKLERHQTLVDALLVNDIRIVREVKGHFVDYSIDQKFALNRTLVGLREVSTRHYIDPALQQVM
jgi:hypothetical protein